MESYLLKISCRDSGSLLQNKTFVPVDGPILSITNSSLHKTISFVRAAWNKSGTKIAACDCQGNVYLFNFLKNRYFLAHKFSTCSTLIVFSSDSEILVALADCNISLLNLDFKTVRNNFNFHSSCVTSISFDKSGFKVLSASKDEAILWDFVTFDILRVLTLKKSVDIVKVFFLPNRDIIVSAFKDSSVFLWDVKSFTCKNQFLCNDGNVLLNLKAIDCSRDEKLIVCAGKADWFIIWSVPEEKRLYTVALPKNVTVKQISFLPSLQNSFRAGEYILTLLTSESDVCIYNLKNVELLHTVSSSDNKIISYATSSTNHLLLTICLQGNVDVFDVEPFLISDVKDKVQPKAKSFPHVAVQTSKVLSKKTKDKKPSVEVNMKSLKSVVKNFEEFPEKYRFFIWSQLLGLPRNVDAFKVLHQDSLLISQFVKDYSFMNPGVQKTFLRIMAMLASWFPVLREVEYFQCIVFPFVKILHKNTITCFELLVTFISNWCQNWFIFCPFPPFNVLCAVENLLVYHDPDLVTHFIKHQISPEIYAWSLLQTSFSEVFNKHQWFKLWDNIFANPLSYYLYAVVAFNITLRDVLLSCKSVEQFKQCYRKHGISASVLIKKTYQLQETTPADIRPDPVSGDFHPLPKDTYPSFMQMAEMKVDLQSHVRKTLLDQEVDYIKNKAHVYEMKGNYLLEMQKLQLLRRKMFLDNIDIQDSEALDALSRKLKNIQALIQDNLTDQIAMLRGRLDYNLTGTEDQHSQFFQFKEYVKNLKKEKK